MSPDDTDGAGVGRVPTVGAEVPRLADVDGLDGLACERAMAQVVPPAAITRAPAPATRASRRREEGAGAVNVSRRSSWAHARAFVGRACGSGSSRASTWSAA